MTTTIAERHDLQRGDVCEIYRVSLMGTDRRFGKYMLTTPQGEMYFDTGREPLRIFEEKVRSVRKVTEQYVASQFHQGQWVYVRKYGSDYGGVVKAIGRTRVEVEFQTRGGKTKRQSFPAWQVWS